MRFFVGIASTLLALVAAEFLLRLAAPAPTAPTPGEHLPCGSCPYVYAMDPARPGIGPLGIRAFDPDGRPRVLLLGDSVTYGPGVAPGETYAARLQALLPQWQVINAGVSGYNTYNELEFYKAHARELHPAVVVIQFCPNDIVDPLLHWSNHGLVSLRIPPGAIPNPAYHQGVAEPAHRLALRLERWRSRLRLADLAYRALWPRWEAAFGRRSQQFREIGGRRWPVYLTLEDNKPIDLLEDRDSPEWQWLAARYRELGKSVQAQGGRLVVVLVPLAYQLDPGYPIHPENAWAAFCREAHLECLDMLDDFRGRSGLYLLGRSGYEDVWHLSESGHARLAARLAALLGTG